MDLSATPSSSGLWRMNCVLKTMSLPDKALAKSDPSVSN